MQVRETPYERPPGYAARYRDARFATGTGPATHRREARALAALIDRAGRDLDVHAPWLDVPSGAGRLTAMLPGRAVCVDRNPDMLRACTTVPGGARLCASIHRLPFRDAVFSGALCMRLLQHIPGSTERRAILGELRRVCRGPLILSFFHAASLQHLRRVVSRLLGRKRSSRGAIRFAVLRADLQAAGYTVVAKRPLRWLISEQWLVLALPRAD